jgi:hypothetical protein
MMNPFDGAANLNGNTAFTDIQWDEGTQWNTVYCPNASCNFRAGESVELKPPVEFPGTTFHSQVGAILQVDATTNPPHLLLSLFLNLSAEMAIRHEPPHNQVYAQYPTKQVIWTRYRGWYPVPRIRREAFVVSPWEVNASKNAANLGYGMSNAYCIVASWKHDTQPPRSAFCPLGNGINHIPGCLHLIADFECCTERSWAFRRQVAEKIVEVLSKSGQKTRTRVCIHIGGIPLSQWNHFKMRTIPPEATEKKGIITKKTTRKALVTEMIRDKTINHLFVPDDVCVYYQVRGSAQISASNNDCI